MVTATNFGQFSKANIETLNADKTLNWADSPIQVLRADANRIVTMPLGGEHRVGTTYFIANIGNANTIQIAASSMASGQSISLGPRDAAILTYVGYEKSEDVRGNIITETERKWIGGVMGVS